MRAPPAFRAQAGGLAAFRWWLEDSLDVWRRGEFWGTEAGLYGGFKNTQPWVAEDLPASHIVRRATREWLKSNGFLK
jgi:hypothetical protein